MMQILRLGENTIHNDLFVVDRPNGHPVYLLILIKTPSEFFIDDDFKYTPADVAVIFKPGQKHLYRAAEGQLSKEEAYIDCWMHIESNAPIISEHFPFGKPVILHNPKEYYDLFHIINNEYYKASSHRNRILEHLTNALIDKICDESNTEEYPEIYYKLANLRERIYSAPDNDWKIGEIASDLGVSMGYFHSLYRRFFDTTCISDVVKSRIQTACELLVSSNKSIEEIGLECGYNHTEHFIRQFKSETGFTPSKYRKQ